MNLSCWYNEISHRNGWLLRVLTNRSTTENTTMLADELCFQIEESAGEFEWAVFIIKIMRAAWSIPKKIRFSMAKLLGTMPLFLMKERAFLPLLKTSVAQLTIIWNSAGKEELNLTCQSALRDSDGNWNQGPDTQKRGLKQAPKCRFARVFCIVWCCESCSLSCD